MYIKSTDKSHYLLRLFTIDVSKYYGGNVHYISHIGGVKGKWRDGLREPVLTLGCLAGKKRSNRKDQTISQQGKDAIVELMSAVLENPDDLSIVNGSISYIEKLKGFQHLKGVDDFTTGFIAQLELNRAYFQEKPLDHKQLSQLRSCFQHHIPYLIAARRPQLPSANTLFAPVFDPI